LTGSFVIICLEWWKREVDWVRVKRGLQLNEITLDHEKSPAWLSLRYLYSSSLVFFVFPGILGVEIVFYFFFFRELLFLPGYNRKKSFFLLLFLF